MGNVKDLAHWIDVDVETLMKTPGTTFGKACEDLLRKRQLSRTLPFDERNEVSADARFIAGRIVKHLWLIAVLLPVVSGILFAVISNK
jgi:hypothetical protein